MTKPIHLIGSLLCGCVLGITTPTTITGLFLGYLLSDVDTGTSALGHFFFWQSGKNHRGFLRQSKLFLFLYPVDKENRKSIRLVKELGGVPMDEVEDFTKEDGRVLHLVTYVLPKQ